MPLVGWIRAGRRLGFIGVAALALALAAARQGLARAAAPDAEADAAPPTAVMSVAGVGTRLPWKASAPASAGKGGGPGPRLLWTGFRSLPDGHGAEIWLQTSGPVESETIATPEGAILRLKTCRNTLRRTDALPLETRYFASAVSRVTVARHGHDLDVRVGLKVAGPSGTIPGRPNSPSSPSRRREPGPDGSWFWVFAFPSPQVAPHATPSPSPGPTASAVP